ncbi:MAG: hypothetical protein ABI147_09575 [Acidobacteriaceae bacterium]
MSRTIHAALSVVGGRCDFGVQFKVMRGTAGLELTISAVTVTL